MAAIPILEETSGGAPGTLIRQFAGEDAAAMPPELIAAMRSRRPARRLSIYPALAGFDLAADLDFLSARAIEPNIFFNPRFLVPAMPRLEDRDVRLAVIRDGDADRSRLRLLVPFSIEKPALPFSTPVIRAWSHPFGPLGTPLVDSDDPAGVVEDFLEMLARPHLKLPRVLVLPETRLDGPFAAVLGSLAEAHGLPMTITERIERPILASTLPGEDYLKASLSSRHLKEFRRMERRLGELGPVAHEIARQPDAVREGIETFLGLEASGWKGRSRTAMAIDRYHAAFVREAAFRLAERDLCRVHTLTVAGRPAASLVVFVESGVAYTWKTAYDEDLSAYSPGMLLMMDVTRHHLEDPNIETTDSCAVPDHPMMTRLWQERRPLGTIILGLSTDADRHVRQAATQLQFHRGAVNFARRMRSRVTKVLRKG